MSQVAVIRHCLSDEATRRLYGRASPDAIPTPSPQGLRLRVRGPDPFVFSPTYAIDMGAAKVVRVTADSLGQRGHALKVYFASDDCPVWCEEQSLELRAPAIDGPIALDFDFRDNVRWRGHSVSLRIDLEHMKPGDAAVELRAIELVATPSEVRDLALPSLPPVPSEPFHLLLDLSAASAGIAIPEVSTSLRVRERPHPDCFQSGERGVVHVAYLLEAVQPGLESFTLAPLGPEGKLVADIWIRNPSAPPVHASPEIALEGEIVLLRRNGVVCARLVPEVTLTIGAPQKVRRVALGCLREARAEGGKLSLSGHRRLDGIDVRARLDVGPSHLEGDALSIPLELSVDAAAPLQALDVKAPVVLMGDPDRGAAFSLALLPGVEMRTRERPDAAGYYADPELLCWRAAVLEQEGGVCVVTWDTPGLAPVLAAPDVLSGQSHHALELHFPPREGPQSLTSAPHPFSALAVSGRIVLAPKERGRALVHVASLLCEAPLDSDPRSALARSARALATTFRGQNGLTLPTLPARDEAEYFDPRSCLSLIAAARLGISDHEASAETEIELLLQQGEAAPVPLAVGLVEPRSLHLAVRTLVETARDRASSQRSDGTWPPRIPPGCHAAQPELLATTAGAIAEPACALLHATLLGLVPEGPARRALERLRDPDLLPCGGQWWEFAPSVPEVMGAAIVADAFVLSREAGIAPDGLDRALDWLGLALTFFRLRKGDRHPFACTPALGVTRATTDGLTWFTHAPWDRLDWRGVSCPWVGLRVADSLERFVAAVRRHGQESAFGEAVPVLERVSRGTFAHALSLSRDDGSIPDGFDMRAGVETEPLYRAPLDLAWHALRLIGSCPDATIAREGPIAAAGIGSFSNDGHDLIFKPALPGPQALLLAGGARLEAPSLEVPARDMMYGLGSSTIQGPSPVRIHPA